MGFRLSLGLGAMCAALLGGCQHMGPGVVAAAEPAQVDPISALPEAEPVAPPSSAVEVPEPTEVETASPESAGPELVAQFKAERPRRLAMPVPVFARETDFETLVPGWVEVEVQIDATGRVSELELLEASHPELVEPALEALREALYTPVRDPLGQPLFVRFRDRIDF